MQAFTQRSLSDLLKTGYPGAANGEIYAVFEIVRDGAYNGRKWDREKLIAAIEKFEKRRNYRTGPLGHDSALPRVMSLQELLTAMKLPHHPQQYAAGPSGRYFEC